jgi:PBP1b-binding outer membrane lipoprotein LpoB
MLNKKIMLAGAAALALALTGCSTTPAPRSADPLLGSVQLAADGLAAQLNRHHIAAPIIVASAQNNDQLNQVCPQGRLVSDIVSSRLTQAGFPVTEVRLTNALRINQEGETILSRELGALAKAAKAELVVTATWSTLNAGTSVKFANAYGALESSSKGGQTYVTLKAVRLADGLVLSSQTFAPPTSWSCN